MAAEPAVAMLKGASRDPAIATADMLSTSIMALPIPEMLLAYTI
jgi:hypothetical protein